MRILVLCRHSLSRFRVPAVQLAVVLLSVNNRELLAVERSLSLLRRFLRGLVVGVFSVDTTAVACFRHQGGMLSLTFIALAQRILHWPEQVEVSTRLQFVPGRNNIVTDSWIRSLPIPSRGELWRRSFGLFDARVRWSLRLLLWGVLHLHVCGNKGIRSVGVVHRPLHLEPFYGCVRVSDEDCSVSPPFGAEERLDGGHRSEGRIPSDSDLSSESEVLRVHGRRASLAAQGSLLRAVHTDSACYPGYGSDLRVSFSPRRLEVEPSASASCSRIPSAVVLASSF